MARQVRIVAAAARSAAVQEKLINSGVVASYQDSRAMTARGEQDRKLTPALFGH